MKYYEKFRPSIFLLIIILSSLLIEKIFGYNLDDKFFNKIQELTTATNVIGWLIFVIIPLMIGIAISYIITHCCNKFSITIKGYKDFIMIAAIFPPLLSTQYLLFIEIAIYISLFLISFLTGEFLLQALTKDLSEDYIEILSTITFFGLIISIQSYINGLEYAFIQLTSMSILCIIFIYNFFKFHKSSP